MSPSGGNRLTRSAQDRQTLRRHTGFKLPTFQKGENYRPIIWITPAKRCSREALFSSSWHFLFRRRGSASGSDLGGSTPGQSLDELRFFLSHFPPRRTSSKPTGPRSAPPLSCGDVLFVSAIQSSAMGAAASRRTINITTGLGSGAVTALGATRPSLSSRRFLCLTRTIACWLVAKPCGGAWRSTALGKRRRLISGPHQLKGGANRAAATGVIPFADGSPPGLRSRVLTRFDNRYIVQTSRSESGFEGGGPRPAAPVL